MEYQVILRTLIIPIVVPFIEHLIDSTVVPLLQRKAYERFNDFADDRIESLIKLKEKASKENDPLKKAAHEEGIKLGTDTLRALGNKLVQAADLIAGE